MIRKPTSGDSDQRAREAERARKHSQLSAAQVPREVSESPNRDTAPEESGSPRHGAGKGESAHGAIPRPGIDSE